MLCYLKLGDVASDDSSGNLFTLSINRAQVIALRLLVIFPAPQIFHLLLSKNRIW